MPDAGAVVSCTDLTHPSLQGDAVYRLSSYLPAPMGELDLELARVDIDKMVKQFGKRDKTAHLGSPSLRSSPGWPRGMR